MFLKYLEWQDSLCNCWEMSFHGLPVQSGAKKVLKLELGLLLDFVDLRHTAV